MTTIISDEAVNIALNTWLGGVPAWRNNATERLRTEMRAALTAAAPYMQGSAREQALEEAAHNLINELSGDTGELIDRMAAAIRDWGSHCDDGPWETLPEDRKAGWRGDAERALAVVKEYLTTRALSSPDHADAGKVEGDGCERCGGKGEIVVGKGRHGDTIIEDCPSCTRSQAEAIIAAKNATLQDAIECVKVLTEEKNKLEADNAALIHDLNRIKDHETELVNDNAAKDARIKELEDYFSKCISNETFLEQDARRVRQIKALEAKLAAAEKALELIDKAVSEGRFIRIRKIARAVLGGKPS